MSRGERDSTPGLFRAGEWVQVRNRFNGRWSPGFVVERRLESGYVVRRVRDDSVLPEPVACSDVRRPPALDGRGRRASAAPTFGVGPLELEPEARSRQIGS
jgi:hypothetical protein